MRKVFTLLLQRCKFTHFFWLEQSEMEFFYVCSCSVSGNRVAVVSEGITIFIDVSSISTFRVP